MTTDLSSAGLLSPQPDFPPATTSWRPLSNRQQYERKAPVPTTAATPLPDKHTPILTTTLSSPKWFPATRLGLLLRIRHLIHCAFIPIVLIIVFSPETLGHKQYIPYCWGCSMFQASSGAFSSVRKLCMWRKTALTGKRMFWTSLLRVAIWLPL